VLENRLLRSIYDLMRMGSGRRENKIAYWGGSYFSPNIKMIKSRRTNWACHAAHSGDTKNAHQIFIGKYEGTIYLDDQGQ
jgi:hypothetical protein